MQQPALTAFFARKRKFEDITNHLDSLNGSEKPLWKNLKLWVLKKNKKPPTMKEELHSIR